MEDERLRLVLILRYGLDGGEPKTLQEVAREIGTNREDVRRLQRKAHDFSGATRATLHASSRTPPKTKLVEHPSASGGPPTHPSATNPSPERSPHRTSNPLKRVSQLACYSFKAERGFESGPIPGRTSGAAATGRCLESQSGFR
ncbi:MAG: hypothetical protein M3R38_04920 [Actinomycetota bacterium]|nr:hypothetical protein [Actinomycetota bacterium]